MNKTQMNSKTSPKMTKSAKRKETGNTKQEETECKKDFSSSLDELKSYRRCTLLSLESMEVNHKYKIIGASKCESKFGERILLQLENSQRLYLPERYNNLSEKTLQEMNEGKYQIINRGKVGKTFDLDFELVSNTEENYDYNINLDLHSQPFDISSQNLSGFYNNFG